MSRGGGDENVLHQPAILCRTGFEFRHGTEINLRGIDRLAPFEFLQKLHRTEAYALVLDIDDRAVVGFEGVFCFELDQFVGPNDLKVRAARENLAVDFFALHLAANDRDDPAHAVTDVSGRGHRADLGRDGEGVLGAECWSHCLIQSLDGHFSMPTDGWIRPNSTVITMMTPNQLKSRPR